MREELERLRAESAVAQKDTERLDWLKAHARPTVVRVGCVSFRIRLTREAIDDAAMGGAAKTDPYEANGRLIAAAPELAEALKLWARWDDMTEAELALALDATTAALAKAGVK